VGPARPKALRADARRNRARILAAAQVVFAEKGPGASTEEVAARAGVAIGTVFRHFPTKQALLQSIMKDLLGQLAQEAGSLAADGDPATALFVFFTQMVEQAARHKTVIDLLAASGIDVQIAGSVQLFRQGIQDLLAGAQQAGAVRPDVRADELLALLAATCQGALHGGWDRDLQHRTLAIIFQGLHPGQESLRLLRLLRIMRLEGGDEMPNEAASAARPEDVDAEIARRAARRIGDYLAAHQGADPVRIQGELADDDALVVPRQAAIMLAQILGYLAKGQGVQIMPDRAELTTQQAADFLNVSRPYLIGLLDEGRIPYRMVGTHRRIRFEDLREYKRQDDQHRRGVIDELAELGQELDEY
jgi:excisionase family DNA binding protein